jgi:hypothetical protein
MGLLGKLVYGAFQHEPLGLGDEIDLNVPLGPPPLRYYAAQGNCWRFFRSNAFDVSALGPFRVIDIKTYSALSYVASGGFSKPQLYPACLLPVLRLVERACDLFPSVFSTRMLVTLERT